MDKPIDLKALVRVLGAPPPRFATGDVRNMRRKDWWLRAIKALGKILQMVGPPPADATAGVEDRRQAKMVFDRCYAVMPALGCECCDPIVKPRQRKHAAVQVIREGDCECPCHRGAQ